MGGAKKTGCKPAAFVPVMKAHDYNRTEKKSIKQSMISMQKAACRQPQTIALPLIRAPRLRPAASHG